MARTPPNKHKQLRASIRSGSGEAVVAPVGDRSPSVASEGSATLADLPVLPPPGAAQPAEFRFYIDEISARQVEGWIIRIGQPEHRCVVALTEDGRLLARATASRFRADLAAAGIGDGHHSFVLPIPAGMLDGVEHLIELVEVESGVRLNVEPIRWRLERAAIAQGEGTGGLAAEGAATGRLDDYPAGADPAVRAPELRFHIDQVSERQIEGWVIRPDRPSHRCVVALMEGEEVLARAIASRFRDDLASAGIGDGHHSFVIPLPASVLDGKEHRLEIVERETGTRLTQQYWRAQLPEGPDTAVAGADVRRHAGSDVDSPPRPAPSDVDGPRPTTAVEMAPIRSLEEAPAPPFETRSAPPPMKDFRSVVAFYTHAITSRLAGRDRRSWG